MMNEQVDKPILSVEGLQKTYADFQLKDVHLQIPAGVIMGFMGRNGAGKTTTIESIMDLIKPDRGTISILGMSMDKDEVAIKNEIGYVSDTPILNNAWTVERTINFVKQFYTHWDEAFVEKCLQDFDLSLDKRINQMSKGMKMKFSILLAIAPKPKLLLLDEPTSGLDPVIRDEILNVLLDFMEDGERSILLSSHITSDIEKIADIVVFIDQGEILLNEDKELLLERYRRIVMNGAASCALTSPLLFDCVRTRGGYIGYTDDYAHFKTKAAGEWRAERLTLEELFVLLTNREESQDVATY